jgi:hypothetical protein
MVGMAEDTGGGSGLLLVFGKAGEKHSLQSISLAKTKAGRPVAKEFEEHVSKATYTFGNSS